MSVASRRNYEALRNTPPRCETCGSYSYRDSKPADIEGWMGPACAFAPLDEIDLALRIKSLPPYHVFHHRVRELLGLPCDRDCREPRAYEGESLIERVKAAYRLEEVAGRLTRLYGMGDTLSGRCPLHGEQSGRAFTVWVSSQRWRCFGKCMAGGDVIDLVQACIDKGVEWRERSSTANGQ